MVSVEDEDDDKRKKKEGEITDELDCTTALTTQLSLQ